MADVTRVQTVAVDVDAHPATAAANGIPILAASTMAARGPSDTASDVLASTPLAATAIQPTLHRNINAHIPTELLEMILLAAGEDWHFVLSMVCRRWRDIVMAQSRQEMPQAADAACCWRVHGTACHVGA
jgi:hypothetical protein